LGNGRILYLGWYPNESQAEALLMQLSSQADILPLAKISEGLIASQRGPYRILLNFTEEPLEAIVQDRNVLVKPRDVEILRTNG
jgi:hypothetical protein